MEKKILRNRYLKIRSSIKQRLEKEKKIYKNLISLNIDEKFVISGYYPIRNEVNIIAYLKFLSKKKISICLPSIFKEESHLLFKKWDIRKPLVKGKFNIDEPLEEKYETPSILIVPILAFDKNKNRLGYGGGFYDRTIEFLEKKLKIKTIGVAFEGQKVDKVPIMKFDKKLDLIITENGILK